ncbi:eukaryotic translation initiation factor 5B-like [Glycine soja]|uniref:Eukaryotic translation initiation factor 5B n=1 Tax=Glycine soja TaxID=3848 RepID=A0A445F5Z5_GLYSO|nr:eukaryotic translation initiation factor 5B-like [Glycine soja]RZB44267.1 Eukaryotic translation initiation factor 5B isoform A [Glycine soja]RZB44268.1 Eukaryotic translation initiation factor 5B isoform B [Glycine soja]
MGKKKPTARDEENAVQQGGGGKSKKKAVLIDDDEYSIGTELSEEPAPASEEKPVVAGKKKGKKGNAKAKSNDDDVDEDEDDPEIVFAGKKKGKNKKGGGSSAFTASGFDLLGDERDDDEEKSGLTGEVDGEEEDEPVVSFTGKKKASKKEGGSLFSASAFDAIDDGEEEDGPVISFKGKKKSSKGSKKGGGSLFSASAFDAIDDDADGEVVDDKNDDVDDDEPVIAFTGKKKSSKGGKKGGSVFSAAVLGEIDDGEENKDDGGGDDDDDDIEPITFSGKKKKSSQKAANSVSKGASVEEGDDKDEDDVSLVAFSGKKKSSKKKGSSTAAKGSDENMDAVDPEAPSVGSTDAGNSNVNKSEEVAGNSKNKKKNKKKSGRTAQEEEDLDKLLAELGETPPVPKPSTPPQDDKVQPTPEVVLVADASGEKEGEEETVETAAAKKKKKKKEKEKEKKAAAAAAAAAVAGTVPENETAEDKAEVIEPKKNDSKAKKAADKKVPKHVREMQEALARRQEAEERKKREEEERLRKEEEERRRQEELERQAEEARRRKKEREKEKLQKKKQEGKLLTGKQKEEARRLEAMRKQILNNTGGMTLPGGDSGAPAKKPIYQTKKVKPNNRNQNGAAAAQIAESVEAKETATDVASEEPEKIEEVESVQVDDKVELPVAVEEDGEEDDDEDEWDAKSWDDVNLNTKGAFADEEADSEPKPIVKKEIKNAVPAQNAGATKPVAEEIENGKQINPHLNREPRKSVVPPKPSDENLRSPICCIMGHVDTGKTKLLDCIRGTNVQEGEAGGITQQIGATYFPAENIRERTKELKADAKLKVPGLLVIDTPGHESFTNLRSRGSGLCDIAILVVDIMHGLEQQTIESLNLLKMRNTEFIVALNKVDRLYGWKTCRNAPIVKALKQQTKDVQNEFNMRLTQIITEFKVQGLNTELYYKNKEMGETFSIVPTSAISGEGIPDLLLLLIQWTQKTMVEKLTYSEEVQCTVLEVKVVEGHGTTIDVVLVNGVLHEGEQIVVCGMQGPIVTTIRALLTPHPMKELRVKGTYLHHKEIKAAMGIKITAQGLEHAIAGTGLYVVKPDDDLEDVKESAMEDMRSVMSRIDRTGEGVCVQASTLGSLEALLEFLKTPEVSIPVSGISIGPVHKKDVMKASVMLEKKREYAAILAFDVKVTPEARELADELGVKIFIADIIYHLFDQFKAYIDNIKEEKKREAADEAVFPCVMSILPNCIFNKKDPIVLGVDILEGILKIGTPICIPSREFIDIGRIASIENNHKPVDYAKKGQKVAIKIVGSNSEEQQKMFGRHFEIDDELVSHISRRSIDILKANYRDELNMEEWRLVVKLKNLFKIQ